ncbi:DUF433 domain-containing protein [Saccharolobus caldissimus]|uniref:DUF433 domain-containing protein n=1 Tax=Saccharolobus caldissimus TaxID=1702097 RepID=A0AAQ4CUI2_9CREN|nr:DUF433 domain-containing protein [Saccharolobus caldissimus]BDB99463.1 hypothetical protein SACC_24800 [Saccharolobus caldissimus]
MELPGYYYIVIHKDRHFGRPFIAGTLIRPENVIYELAKGKTFDEVADTFYGQIGIKQIQECVKYAIDVIKILKTGKIKVKVPAKLKKKLDPGKYKYLDKESDRYNPKIKNSDVTVIDVLNRIYNGKEVPQVAEELNISKEAVMESLFFAGSKIDDFHLSLSSFEDPVMTVLNLFNYIRKSELQ